ncbi:peroxiredoxin [Acidomonas methanolica]|uniref:peroxiredoxin n=1 Tax=Acidomonas methanolica TaxID=437 RepID=UPI00211A3BB8|nr:peroxiredoxin [Acidomonas methanolica]MCQ9156140.1 peroxiredoxin [Acidomonas methanolica]
MRLFPLAVFALLAATPAHAALPVGAKAPDFTTLASQGGKEFNYSLADALKKGPVVLYFYPAAFTPGCTVEAHDFAAAVPKYKALGASVIGVSMDPIAKLDRFSVSECRSVFPVAADPDGAVTRAYDAKLPLVSHAARISYVIAPDGHIALAYSAMSPDEHVSRTLAAVEALKTQTAAP